MTDTDQATTVGPLPSTTDSRSLAPVVLTRLVWALFAASLLVLAVRARSAGPWEFGGILVVDGLTAVMWVVVAFFSGVVHSYSRRYMAGDRCVTRFFGRVFAFTLAVMVLVAARNLALFAAAWLAMGLLMADLIGYVRGWPQAAAASRLARRYFLASSALLSVGLGALWWTSGATTIDGVASAAAGLPTAAWAVAAGALLLAAMIQSALVPFQTWVLSSMTAPTPASALMHAGFVNAGGILLLRFAPVVTVHAGFMALIVAVGAASALLGKLLKSVQTDVKGQLGCSTTGQMSFMIMQAGLGFFGAAITHLILHGFYKAYQFLSSGGRVTRNAPAKKSKTVPLGPIEGGVVVVSAALGGLVFAVLTGDGLHLDSGLLLTLLVVLTTMQATRTALAHADLAASARYAAIPLVFLPAIAVYAGAYQLITGLLVGVPLVTAPTALTPVHLVVAAGFFAVYVLVEFGAHERSERLYMALVNAAAAPTPTLTTAPEEYNEY